jgi:hypothetical protein
MACATVIATETTSTVSAAAAAPSPVVPWQQRRSVRACYVLILIVLAACAFADSFVALAELARATGALPGDRAITLPLILDGLTLAGTLFAVTRFGRGQGSPAYGYALIAIGSLASLAGNVAHAPDDLGARVIAGAPQLILRLLCPSSSGGVCPDLHLHRVSTTEPSDQASGPSSRRMSASDRMPTSLSPSTTSTRSS